MVDPNDYLHAQVRLGTGLCEVVNANGRMVMGCRRGNDKAAIRDLRIFIEQILAERASASENLTMWILFLNDIRDPKPESVKAVFRAENKDELQALVAREAVAPYEEAIEHMWGKGKVPTHSKSFRKGGPLEWYNPPLAAHDRGHFKHMQPVDDVVKKQVEVASKQIEEQIRAYYTNLVTSLPECPKP